MGRDVIIALDFATAEKALAFLDQFNENQVYVKVGMELFYAAGPDIVRQIKARGHKLFLDLKLHDIPNTVERAMAALSRLDVDMCNLACRRHGGHDARRPSGPDPARWNPPAADRGYAADIYESRAYGAGAAD